MCYNVSREMKKIIAFFFMLIPLVANGAAVQITKAPSVATAESSGGGAAGGAGSLVGTLMGLATNVMSMNEKVKALTAECIPSATEITFINNTMQEYAKIGQTTADALKTSLKRERCSETAKYGDCYADEAKNHAEGLPLRYSAFFSPADANMVWWGFPKAAIGKYCSDGMPTCDAKKQVTVSDAYDLFNLIDFAPGDYLPGEATMAARLLNKVESCSTAKLSAKKKALWGEFLITTAGGIGSRTNTGGIMEQVGAMTQGGGGAIGALGGLGSMASQFMMK